ncbi:hypothetical protein IP93_00762 [Lysobacter ruishenii]|uniref:Uncharacterized protein n=2 Tax=Aerolutibacter ruishenii TaxID=686800 RepID=A0A562M110_9GAMM|nr:hypothetical protein IP93_00762 [Lysobacter ruishenii]
MTTRAMGPMTGLGWLKRGINLGRHNPKAIFGGAVLVAIGALLPGLLQLMLLGMVGDSATGQLVVMGVSTVASIVLMSLLVGGYIRVIHATEQGHPAAPTDVLGPFRAGQGGARLVQFGVLLVLVYLVLASAVILLVGKGFIEWYMQVMALSQRGGAPDPNAMPALPEGFGSVMGLGFLMAMFLGGVYSIGFGQVALTGRSLGGALKDGLAGTLKNLLPLLLLAVLSMLALIAVALVIGLVVTLLALLGNLVHPALGMLLALPVYLALLLGIYVVMFGVMYQIWRDVAGDVPPPVAPPAVGTHVEL